MFIDRLGENISLRTFSAPTLHSAAMTGSTGQLDETDVTAQHSKALERLLFRLLRKYLECSKVNEERVDKPNSEGADPKWSRQKIIVPGLVPLAPETKSFSFVCLKPRRRLQKRVTGSFIGQAHQRAVTNPAPLSRCIALDRRAEQPRQYQPTSRRRSPILSPLARGSGGSGARDRRHHHGSEQKKTLLSIFGPKPGWTRGLGKLCSVTPRSLTTSRRRPHGSWLLKLKIWGEMSSRC
jgi:hypothetical protein